MLSSLIAVIERDEKIKELYISKNKKGLYLEAKNMFEEIKDKYGITHWYFILPDGRCFLRVHNEKLSGDQINRYTYKEAKTTKKESSGIELGKTAYALRVVSPYYSNGKLIGYMELGQEIDDFLNVLKTETGDEFSIIVEKK